MPILADNVWPLLYEVDHSFVWLAVGVGLLAELPFYAVAFQGRWGKALLANLAANAASSLATMVCCPFSIPWLHVAVDMREAIVRHGQLDIPGLVAFLAICSAVSTVIEYPVVRYVFKPPIPVNEPRAMPTLGGRLMLLLLAANFVSTFVSAGVFMAGLDAFISRAGH